MSTHFQRAVIYCRVSSEKQVREGAGLISQETRCREYAKLKSYKVTKIFHDEGISGSLSEREGIQSMLAFLRERKAEKYIVIIDDISRLARGLEAHIELRNSIDMVGARLESPSIEFGKDSDSQLIEYMLASVAQHQRQKNAEQTRHRMYARLQNGYWPFSAPIGYTYQLVKGRGRILVPVEPLASVIKEGLEGYAKGRFTSIAELQDFFTSNPHYPKGPSGKVPRSRIHIHLNQKLYAGYLEYKPWGIDLMKAEHKGIISYITFQRIQEVLNGKRKLPYRKDLNKDFPLRGFVHCDCCKKPLTASWSKGRNGKYAYYLCRNKYCIENGRSIKREVIEKQFEELISGIRAPEKVIQWTLKIFERAWKEYEKSQRILLGKEKEKIPVIEKKIEQLFDRILDCDHPALIKNYEAKVSQLENEKAIISSKLQNEHKIEEDYTRVLQTIVKFLEEPLKIWQSEGLHNKHAFLRMVFSEPLTYNRIGGFQTAGYSLPITISKELEASNCNLAGSQVAISNRDFIENVLKWYSSFSNPVPV